MTMYAIVWAVDLVTKIGDLEVFILLVSCICHDLDHPGYNNIYQINARTELALRYNDISPLENHHCSVAFRVLEAPACNILASFDSITYRTVREGIIRCILATDMARHNEILAEFTDAMSDFDYTSTAHVNLLSMILIKVADISNEARPMDVAEPWLDSLLQEFFKQSDAEKLEGLPVTPFMDRDKVTKPSSQCSFIGLVLLPLFEALGKLFPVLQELIVEPVRYALDYYRQLNEAAKDERLQRKSLVELAEHALGSQVLVSSNGNKANIECQEQMTTIMRCSSIQSINRVKQTQQEQNHRHYFDEQLQQSSNFMMKSTSINSMRSELSKSMLHPRSHSIEDEQNDSKYKKLSMYDGTTNLSISDPETVTEVEVSEKTLKFKISTEGASGSGRKSYPGSRKGSREKSSLDYYNYEHEHQKIRDEIVYNELNSPQSFCSTDEMHIHKEVERDAQQRVKMLFTEDQAILNGCFTPNTDQQLRYKHRNKRTLSYESSTTDTDCSQSFNSNNVTKNQMVNTARVTSDYSQNQLLYNDMTYHEHLAYCCCDDKPEVNNQKSLISRLRHFTDRLNISFDSKDTKVFKNVKCSNTKSLNKTLTMNAACSTIQHQQLNNNTIMCKRCNLYKTLPKVKYFQIGKQKSWRTVFVKEKRSTRSFETLPIDSIFSNTNNRINDRQSLSNSDGKSIERNVLSTNPTNCSKFKQMEFQSDNPEIFSERLDADSSSAIADIGVMEIRKSSASMEDISKITKQSDLGQYLLGTFEQVSKSDEFQQHTGSLDSILTKNIHTTHRRNKSSKPKVNQHLGNVMTDSLIQPKKSLSGLFSRLKLGISIDGTRSNSNSDSLHDQHQPSQQGWLSNLTASFRSKRETYEQSELLSQLSTPFNEEDVK
ncbi:uncharacterized protein LOC131669918 isoform X2 [Phymastichus coffea]|uniref:uncharacterized protein LOC131669918 isoform X2 n=1 Tax=Phymastichus coffea TaxID=108790 RepID=UPI00273B6ADA|nr:uncharacterized protein LOC131669918 isoform X2 [Phymastichus coffea]